MTCFILEFPLYNAISQKLIAFSTNKMKLLMNTLSIIGYEELIIRGVIICEVVKYSLLQNLVNTKEISILIYVLIVRKRG